MPFTKKTFSPWERTKVVLHRKRVELWPEGVFDDTFEGADRLVLCLWDFLSTRRASSSGIQRGVKTGTAKGVPALGRDRVVKDAETDTAQKVLVDW
jgi:hypothetical protein